MAHLILVLVLSYLVSAKLSLPVKRHDKILDIQATKIEESEHAHLCKLNLNRFRHSERIGTQNINLRANTAEYYVPIAVGEPPQLLNVQVDTGSTIMIIPGKGCSTCGNGNRYDRTQSSTSSPLGCSEKSCNAKKCYDDYCYVELTYGDGSQAQGYFTKDEVGFFNEGTNQTGPTVDVVFGNIMDETQGFEYYPVDGIMGLAYSASQIACEPSCTKGVFDNFVDNSVFEDIFAINLENTFGNGTGFLTLGGDGLPNNFNGQVYYTEIKQESYYVVGMNDISVGGYSIGTDSRDYTFVSIVDSGTTLTLIGQQQYDSVVNVFQTQFCNLPYVCGDTNILQDGVCVNASMVDISTFDSFPNITFWLDNLKATISPRDYIVLLPTNSGNYWCMGIAVGSDDGVILGDTFMKAFHVIFDRQNQRLGFVGPPGSLESYKTHHPLTLQTILLISFGTIAGLVVALCAGCMVILVIRKRKRTSPLIQLEQSEPLLADS